MSMRRKFDVMFSVWFHDAHVLCLPHDGEGGEGDWYWQRHGPLVAGVDWQCQHMTQRALPMGGHGMRIDALSEGPVCRLDT